MEWYYAGVVAVSCLALAVLALLIRDNMRLSEKTKRRFYGTYVVIVLAALSEMAAELLNGAPAWTHGIHLVTKCLDYTLFPYAAVYFVSQVSPEGYRNPYLQWLLRVNVVLEILSVFTGWIFYVDEANYYAYGPAHFLYIVIYCVAMFFVLMEYFAYSHRFQKKNVSSLLAIGGLTFFGIALQEFASAEIRTCSLSLVLGSILLFIHYSEFAQMQNEQDHRILLEKDPLTGMLNRYAYNEEMNKYAETGLLSRRLVILSIDVNGLKSVNDTFGHEAGDELIRGAATCLLKCLEPIGKCFRTGGDEFVALLEADEEEIERLKRQLERETRMWQGKYVKNLSLAVGSAAVREYPEVNIERLFHIADQRMYEEKNRYYRQRDLSRSVR